MYQVKYVFGHYNVYAPSGRFLFSADTESEAYNTLSIDAMALMSDAMAIAANEEFAAFAELLTGTLDIDDMLPQIKAELEKAGIYEIQKEAQAQLDAYLGK